MWNSRDDGIFFVNNMGRIYEFMKITFVLIRGRNVKSFGFGIEFFSQGCVVNILGTYFIVMRLKQFHRGRIMRGRTYSSCRRVVWQRGAVSWGCCKIGT